MDINIKDVVGSKKMETRGEIVFGIIALVVLTGFAPGIMATCIFFTIQNGGLIERPDNVLWETVGVQISLSIVLLTTILILLVLKRKYKSWSITLKRYLIISLISLVLAIFYGIAVSAAQSIRDKEKTEGRSEEEIANEKIKKMFDDTSK